MYNNIFDQLLAWKQKTMSVAILKPRKPFNEPLSCRPISQLSVCYKVIERFIYQKVYSTIIGFLIEQAGLRTDT